MARADRIDDDERALVRDALRALGVERFVLAIHDVSFPGRPGEDSGRGSPYSRGARDLLEMVRALGFDGVQLGPQGQTSPGNASPYDGSVFSKSHLSVPLAELAGERYDAILPRDVFEAIVGATPPPKAAGVAAAERAHYAHAFAAHARALAVAAAHMKERAAGGDGRARAIAEDIASFRARAAWLDHDARFETFAQLHGTDDYRAWPEGDRAPSRDRVDAVSATAPATVEAYELAQWVLDREHRVLRETLGALELRLYGDLQVGLSLRDRWRREDLFLPGYLMGAPPSRTNPEGQPWGYPVLDPRTYVGRARGSTAASAPLSFLRARLDKLYAEFDGVRLDHPHGLVCPWVYDSAALDPLAAVQRGARLFESPDEPGHPALAALAIARPDQIDRSGRPYDDGRVRELTEDQIAAYATIVDLVVDAAAAAGRSSSDVLCEILSTCPRPLHEVRVRHGLGRFRVTQKASLTDQTDGYRGENAERADWTMIGNHDTDPLRRVIARWRDAGTTRARADYLATRLEPAAVRRPAFAAEIAANDRRLAVAMLAELFVGPASNVLVFWADLFGEVEAYNTPGVVSPANWTMRVPQDFRAVYGARRREGVAPSLPAALALALRARGLAQGDGAALASALEARGAAT